MPSPGKNAASKITAVRTILKEYDSDGNGQLDEDEIEKMADDFSHKKGESYAVLASNYDADGDGILEANEIDILQHDIHLTDMFIRYAGYMGLAGRMGRYFRVVAKGVAGQRMMKLSYAGAFAFIGCDVGFEGYCAWKAGARKEIVCRTMLEQSTFELASSIILPLYTMKGIGKLATKALDRPKLANWVRLHKYGPMFAALCTVPLLPYMYDRVTAAACKIGFQYMWPIPQQKKKTNKKKK